MKKSDLPLNPAPITITVELAIIEVSVTEGFLYSLHKPKVAINAGHSDRLDQPQIQQPRTTTSLRKSIRGKKEQRIRMRKKKRILFQSLYSKSNGYKICTLWYNFLDDQLFFFVTIRGKENLNRKDFTQFYAWSM